jgi:PEP-CTERM motif
MRNFVYLFVLAGSFTGTSLYATTILSENFDELTPQLTVFSAGQLHTINGTNVDIIGGGLFGGLVVPPESGNVVDLGGSGGNSIGQLQSAAITLNPGTYSLSFDLVGSQRGVTTTTGVTLAPASGPALYSHDFTLASNDDASGIVNGATFTVSGSPETVLLTFSLLGGTVNIGSLLDNVSIVSAATTSPIPEPSSLLLLGSGLAALAGLVRRSRGNRVA